MESGFFISLEISTVLTDPDGVSELIHIGISYSISLEISSLSPKSPKG